MAADLQDTVRDVLMGALEGAGRNLNQARKASDSKGGRRIGKLALGAGALAAVPLAAKGISAAGGDLGRELAENLDLPGGLGGMLSGKLKEALPFGDGDDDQSGEGMPGVGKGRRMPVQQSVDIGVPIETVYNQFTQFELWPQFMHRVIRVSQEDDCTLGFAVKIWGKTKEFTVALETQRPDERVKWKVTEGMTHTGVVSFHELGPRLTRVLVGMDLEPGGMLEKAARGMRYLKRAVRADLHRFKAFIEMSEQETGAWRGVIEHGEVVEDHDASYDEQREYVEVDELMEGESGEPQPPTEQEAEPVRRSRGRQESSSQSRQSRRRGSHASRGSRSRSA